MRTWAYGKKILFIRGVYWLLAICVFAVVFSMIQSGMATKATADAGVSIPATARPLAPFILVSIVMVNALAVTSITTERDGRALDLLRVTDILSPGVPVRQTGRHIIRGRRHDPVADPDLRLPLD